MKTLIISILILLVILTGVIINAVWARDQLTEAIELTSTLSAATLPRLREHWEHTANILSFTAHRKLLGEINDEISKAETAAKEGNEYEFCAAKNSILLKLTNLMSSQCFDIKTII